MSLYVNMCVNVNKCLHMYCDLRVSLLVCKLQCFMFACYVNMHVGPYEFCTSVRVCVCVCVCVCTMCPFDEGQNTQVESCPRGD